MEKSLVPPPSHLYSKMGANLPNLQSFQLQTSASKNKIKTIKGVSSHNKVKIQGKSKFFTLNLNHP